MCKSASGLLLAIATLITSSCNISPSNDLPDITFVSDTAFADTSEVDITVRDGFKFNLWAPGPLLAGPVAISFDDNGVAYVSETIRRKSSDLDIREHRDWMIEDLALTSVEETEAFHKAKLATELSDQNTWQEDFNGDSLHDWRDLMVQSERIRRIWDSDNDGRADASNIFADGFNDMLTGVAAGVLWHDKDVFMTAAPDVHKLRDLDGDGDADKREVISHGYGIHIAYAGHDMSGLTLGPDGKVYWSIGDLGVNVTGPDGKHWKYPNQGAVMRCNPDGSDFEVFAHGLRNPQELAFDTYGNLFSADNDGDHAGERERIVHILEGSDSGWRINWQFGKYNEPHEGYKVWMDEKLYIPHFPGQAAYILPPLAFAPDGPAGFAFNPGTALGEKYKNFFFGSYFKGSAARSMLHAFRVEPNGASYKVAEEFEVVKGIASTGVAWGIDGCLYVTDWLDGYDKKPIGRVWKLDVSEYPNPQRGETQRLMEVDFSNYKSEDLQEVLNYEDMRVRMKAQYELAKRNAIEELVEVATQSDNQFARIHAIWGIGQLARKDVKYAESLISLLEDGDGEIRAQAAKMLGDAKATSAAQLLIGQLKNDYPRAQLYAAEALGKIKAVAAFDPLVNLLEAIGESDPHLRHSVVLGMARLGDEGKLAQLAQHESEAVRVGAVVALRELKSPRLADFMKDSSPLVMAEAARAINDDWSVEAAFPALAEALNRTDIKDEAFVRRAINANFRLADEASARRLLEFASDPKASEAMRADALWALGCWSNPPVLDRVTGRYRGKQPHEPQDALTAIGNRLNGFIRSGPVSIRATAAEVAGRLGYDGSESLLYEVASNINQPSSVRQSALKALVDLKSNRMLTALENALASRDVDVRKTAQSLMGEIDVAEPQLINMLSKVLIYGEAEEKQQVFQTLGKFKGEEAIALVSEWMDKLINKQVDRAAQLDLLLSAEQIGTPALKTKIETYESKKDASNPNSSHIETLYGGNARRGGRLAFTNNSAQCIRCHEMRGFGGQVGPPLDKIASVLSREELLASLIEPSARIAPGYGSIVLTLKDESRVGGTFLGESATTVKVKAGTGEEREILKSDIAERQDVPSAMPTMRGLLSKSEIRDLVAFLATLQ